MNSIEGVKRFSWHNSHKYQRNRPITHKERRTAYRKNIGATSAKQIQNLLELNAGHHLPSTKALALKSTKVLKSDNDNRTDYDALRARLQELEKTLNDYLGSQKTYMGRRQKFELNEKVVIDMLSQACELEGEAEALSRELQALESQLPDSQNSSVVSIEGHKIKKHLNDLAEDIQKYNFDCGRFQQFHSDLNPKPIPNPRRNFLKPL